MVCGHNASFAGSKVKQFKHTHTYIFKQSESAKTSVKSVFEVLFSCFTLISHILSKILQMDHPRPQKNDLNIVGGHTVHNTKL